MKEVKAEIITIGDEILYGQILDSNSKWLSEQLTLTGFKVVQQTSIGDSENVILQTLTDASHRADLILITGGLGPTNDDLTKPTLAKFFNVDYVMNEEALQHVTNFFESRGIKLSEVNRMQAALPSNAEIVENPLGTAPAMWFDVDGTVYVSMPGVPFEMKKIMTDVVLPRVRNRFHTPIILHKVIKTIGVGESRLAEKIESVESSLPDNISIAYLPNIVEVRIRLTATGVDEEKLRQQVQKQQEKLEAIIGKYVYGYDDELFAAAIGQMLRERNKSIAVAESCTGGFLGHLITSVPGSSDYFLGGTTAYANERKVEDLGISTEILDKYGAVSEKVAKEMARGALKKYGSDYSLATTGIAGPGGGSEEKPVGTVWIALADKNGTKTKLLQLTKNRVLNIEATAKMALNLLRQRMMYSDQKSG